ncbi:MAG TPA: hypothetical protein VJU81_02760 [Methylomirabilota bacterium]|nr:hypothetical protein [Methylomirabilota bacterium]
MSQAPRPAAAGGLPPTVPLGYLAAAAGAYVLAALGVVWLAPELSRHYYQPRVIALTHLVTLGWITLAIMGASYQIVPVVLGRPLWSARLARWQLGILVVSVAGMVSHFFRGTSVGLLSAAALLAVGIVLHLVNLAMSLRGFRGWTFTARAVVLGYAGLALTTLFGLALGVNRLWLILPGDVLSILHAHVHLALLGWVTPMVFGVSARIYPMFLLAPEPAPALGRVQLLGLAAGVPMLVVGLIAAPGLVLPGALGVAAAVAAHGLSVIAMIRGRKRPALDAGLRVMLSGALFLVPLTAMGLGFALDLLSGPRAALAYAALALGGWISLTIAGAMLKIVPFLVWYRVYSPQAGRAAVPTLAQLAWPRMEALAYALLVSGIILLALGVGAAEVRWIRGAGVVLVLGALALAAALGHVLRHLAVAARVPGLRLGVRLQAP